MQLTKFKITASKCPGHMIVVYNNGTFKSILNEFNPPLTEKQLNCILNYIPNNPKEIVGMFAAAWGNKITVEPVRAIGAEPEEEATPGYPVNEKIALWCRFYADYHKDDLGQPVKYKTGAAEAGKLKGLPVSPEELTELFDVYFKADEWWSKPKSISNFVKKYNEIRAITYARTPPKSRKFPLPYDENTYNSLSFTDKRAYHDYLRESGYRWETNPGRGGKWVKDHSITA
jgi:hypothetical protein